MSFPFSASAPDASLPSDMDQLLRQRSAAAARGQGALAGLSLYGQVFIGLSLYLYDHVSTPGYISILLTAPFLVAVCLAAQGIARRTEGKGIVSAVGAQGARAVLLILAAVGWLDAQLAFFALCALAEEALPQANPLGIAMGIAAADALALSEKEKDALPRVGQLLRWIILPFLLYAFLTALPRGNAGHLFPLWGQGGKSIFRGTGWMCGCLAGACWPLLKPEGVPAPLYQKKRVLLVPTLLALLLGALTALAGAYLLPFHALARPETMGWRMLLFSNMSASVTAWSLLVTALLFLLLVTLSAGVSQAAGAIAWAAGKKAPGPALLILLLLLMVPAGALKMKSIQNALIFLAPWRGAAVLAALITGALGTRFRGGKKDAEPEAKP